MAETLLSFSEVLLFGRLVEDLKIKKANRKGRLGANGFLARQLADKKDPRSARIYGFAYEGAFYQLPEPLILLVHGEGEKASMNAAGRQSLLWIRLSPAWRQPISKCQPTSCIGNMTRQISRSVWT